MKDSANEAFKQGLRSHSQRQSPKPSTSLTVRTFHSCSSEPIPSIGQNRDTGRETIAVSEQPARMSLVGHRPPIAQSVCPSSDCRVSFSWKSIAIAPGPGSNFGLCVASQCANAGVGMAPKPVSWVAFPLRGDRVRRCARRIRECARNHGNRTAGSLNDDKTHGRVCSRTFRMT